MNRTKLNIIYEDNNLVVVNKEYNQEIIIDNMIPLNSLSKEVSGNVIFLKNNQNRNNFNIKYTYLGIVEGFIDQEVDYQLISRKEKYSIVEFTSFFNDINLREKLMNINHSIIGDYKYKSSMNPIKRICMHLYKIEIDNVQNKQIIYSPIPDSFKIFMV